MSKMKKGTSIISLVLCAVAFSMVVASIVIATNKSAMYMAEQVASEQSQIIESSAYTKVYSKYEVLTIARQAFVNNYLSLHDGKVDMEGFKALVMGEIMQIVPLNQLEEYVIDITSNGVSVK